MLETFMNSVMSISSVWVFEKNISIRKIVINVQHRRVFFCFLKKIGGIHECRGYTCTLIVSPYL